VVILNPGKSSGKHKKKSLKGTKPRGARKGGDGEGRPTRSSEEVEGSPNISERGGKGNQVRRRKEDEGKENPEKKDWEESVTFLTFWSASCIGKKAVGPN